MVTMSDASSGNNAPAREDHAAAVDTVKTDAANADGMPSSKDAAIADVAKSEATPGSRTPTPAGGTKPDPTAASEAKPPESKPAQAKPVTTDAPYKPQANAVGQPD